MTRLPQPITVSAAFHTPEDDAGALIFTGADMTADVLDWARRHKSLTGIGVGLVVFSVLGAIESSPGPDTSTTATASNDAGSSASGSPSPTTQSRNAVALLATLPVKGRAPKTGYDRAAFGPAWSDVDHNGCDTRNDILRRDLTQTVLKPGTNGCVVATGLLPDPYSNVQISFVRGTTTSTAVQIDHVVALSDAWQKGAFGWDEGKRSAFANDPLNLLAVSGVLNDQKGDGDAATWLPPNKAFRAAYVARQVAVKAKYGLWVTMAERDAIARVLADAPETPAPS